jgi:hypothetical protein
MNNDTDWQSFGLGIIAIIGLVFFALFHEIGQAPWPFISILLALVGTFITFAGNLHIQTRNEQKPKKIEIYDRLIKFFFDTILANKIGKKPKSEDELIKGFADMTPDLVLWASDDVLNLYIEFRKILTNDPRINLNDSIKLCEKMLLEIRKDLGHQNNNINELSILGTFINDTYKFSE